MFINQDKLYITKGADEQYLVDEVSKELAPLFFHAYEKNEWHKLSEHKDILAKLEQAGVIYKKTKPIISPKVSIRFYGNAINLPNKIFHENTNTLESAADLLLLVRTNATLSQTLVDYEKITIPHLFIDLAYANIISIGPLVFKNQTTCLACYIGRLSHNWGDPPPPPEPEASTKTNLVMAFLDEKIKQFGEIGNIPDFINNAWYFNTSKFTTKFDRVHMLPWCTFCGASADNAPINLPWGNIL